MNDGPDHYTATICARLCLRRHGRADSPEMALAAAEAAMTRAVRAAVDVAHAAACDVEIDSEYRVTYPSVERAPQVIRPFSEPDEESAP